MTKPKPKPKLPVDAVRLAIERESVRRDDLKPIEVVKLGISAYQAFGFGSSDEAPASAPVESKDRAGLRRGTQAAIDRLLFNVNYWRAAYEDRIASCCPTAAEAAACLQAISAWNSHTMKLNTMSSSEVAASFERFCPPFAANNRRGAGLRSGRGKGPVQDFRTCALEIARQASGDEARSLQMLVDDVQAEARFYASFEDAAPLDAFYDLLPAWCLKDDIDLVTGTWWNDLDVMQYLAEQLHARFLEMGYAQSLCSYFLDAMRESLDNYAREMDDNNALSGLPISELVARVREARRANPCTETDGYGDSLPSWLGPKEQLIWNTVVCAIYGPMHARPLLADDLALLPVEGRPAAPDVITELAERAYVRYRAARQASGIAPEFADFSMQPPDLRNSGLERIESIPDKMKVLGYRIVPSASCYPEQRVQSLRASEVECLAILEHRRWCEERTNAGWKHAPRKDIDAKRSPYLVDWDELPDRAREWNRSAVRDIPELLASVGLAISR